MTLAEAWLRHYIGQYRWEAADALMQAHPELRRVFTEAAS